MPNNAANPLPDTQRIAIIGLGLIGGSIARALRAAGYAGRLTGAVANQEDVIQALELGLVDVCRTEVGAAVHAADLIIVATPPGTMSRVLCEVAAHRQPGSVITDTGSSKGSVIAAARQCFNDEAMAHFVPGHPIAGTENSGLTAGFATLFQGRRVLLTPHEQTTTDALHRVEKLWRLLGSTPAHMNAEHHDQVLAATSHMPHVLAYAMVDTLAEMDQRAEIFANAAGGFADFTRIASSDAGLWRDIVASNRQAVVTALDVYLGQLHALRDRIAAGQDDQMQRTFQRAKTARDKFMAQRETGQQ